MLSKDEIKELLEYKEGKLLWKVKRRKIQIGSEAGYISHGYRFITINYKRYSAHRLTYVYHYGDIPQGLNIDHINGDGTDNNIDNLRIVTQQENCWNDTKAKGYSYDKHAKSFKVGIKLNGKNKHICYCKTESEAREKYLEAKAKYHVIKDRK